MNTKRYRQNHEYTLPQRQPKMGERTYRSTILQRNITRMNEILHEPIATVMNRRRIAKTIKNDFDRQVRQMLLFIDLVFCIVRIET